LLKSKTHKKPLNGLRTGHKTIELRRGNILRGIIVKKEEGSLTDILRQDNYKRIIPIAHGLEEAVTYLKGFYGTVEGRFTTFLKPSYSLL